MCTIHLNELFSLINLLQIYDVVRYRLHRMKKKLKDELESKNTVQEYICPNCGKRYLLIEKYIWHLIGFETLFPMNSRYTALDALRLISPYDEYFHCESCNGVLVAESDKFAPQELGDGDDNARRRRHEKIKDMLSKMEVCPLCRLCWFWHGSHLLIASSLTNTILVSCYNLHFLKSVIF